MDICGGACETIGDLNRSLIGPDILLVFRMKGQVLHRERAHLKVLGCSLVLSALLTKTLPSFLTRLNEISGGCEKIIFTGSGPFWSNFDCMIMRMESEGE